MSTLIQPVLFDSCQTTLRGRRTSFVDSLTAVPPLFTTNPSAAVFDDFDALEATSLGPDLSQKIMIQNISPLSDAHMSDYTSKLIVPRHYGTAPTPETPDTSCPLSGAFPPALHSRKESLIDPAEDNCFLKPKQEHLRWRLASGFFAYFMCGWGDGVTGTVLPYFMTEFHMTFMTSSLLFAGSTCGFFIGTFFVESIIRTLGSTSVKWTRSYYVPYFPGIIRSLSVKHSVDDVRYSNSQARHISLFVSSILHGIFFVVMGTRGGFSSLFLAYAIAAFARSILTATLNAYYAAGPQHSLGYAFGLWSLGSVASPLICQAFISAGFPWYQFYFGSLILATFNTTFLAFTFNPTKAEFSQELDTRRAQTPRSGQMLALSSSAIEEVRERCSFREDGLLQEDRDAAPLVNVLRLALSLPHQWAVCVFALLYCGVETTTQGFMVTYLLHTRHANPKTAGYVTSGFWGGVTIGRLVWGYYAQSLGFTRRKLVIQGCLVIGLAMQLLIWLVKSNIQNVIAVSIIGLVYGPMFPACLVVANEILPTKIRLISMAMISACGSLGSAMFPFVAGAVSNVEGIQTLSYITVPLAGTLTVIWALFPSRLPVGQVSK